MDRLDGKGFHPTVRPYLPHRKRERSKLKVLSNAPLTSWQLAMMKIAASAVDDDGFVIGKLIEMGVLGLNEMVIGPMRGGEIACGGPGDYSMNYADPSRPPPKMIVNPENDEFATCNSTIKEATNSKHGIIHRLKKHLFFKLMFVMLPFVATAIMATSCHKEPYDVVIDWTWGDLPDKELVNQYKNDKNVKTIILNIRPFNATNFSPYMFHNACDHFESDYFSDNHKTIGKGDIYVHPFNGAHLPDPHNNDISGMAEIDSIRWTGMGYGIKRGRPPSR